MKSSCANLLSSLSAVTGAALIAMTLGVTPSYAYQQDAQSACTSDVMRICQQFIPDHGRIASCLTRHRKDLSPACHSVLSSSKKRQRHAER